MRLPGDQGLADTDDAQACDMWTEGDTPGTLSVWIFLGESVPGVIASVVPECFICFLSRRPVRRKG